MAYSAIVGAFNIDTAKTAGQTQAVTGVGFTPKIVLFWWSGSTGTGDGVAGGNVNAGFGAATGATERYCYSELSLDAQADQLTRKVLRNDACIWTYLTNGTGPEGAADLASLDGDGFTLTIDTQFPNAYRINFLALGGTDLTNVKVGPITLPGATGNFSVTDVGFQPAALIVAVTSNTAVNTSATIPRISFGFATGASNQGVVAIYSANGNPTSNSSGYGYNGEVIAKSSAVPDVILRASFVSFDAGGFTLNDLEGTTADLGFYIALKGGNYSVGDIVTKTDGSDIAETVGFTPVALLFASANRALSTQDASTVNARMSIGAATSTTNRGAQAISDEYNLADTETAFGNYDTAVYANILDDAVVGLMDIKSIDTGTGFTAVMDDTDPAGCWVEYLAIGAGVNATVTAVVAASPTAFLPPVIHGSIARTAVVAASSAALLAPVIHASASRTAVVAASLAAMLSPIIRGGATRVATIAASPAAMLAPSLSGNSRIIAVVAASPGAMLSPVIHASASRTAVVATSPAAFLAPAASGGTDGRVTAVVMAATAAMNLHTPTITTTITVATLGGSPAAALAPVIRGNGLVTLASPAGSPAVGLAPVVTGLGSGDAHVVMINPPASAAAMLAPLAITANAIVAVTVMAAVAALLTPIIPGSTPTPLDRRWAVLAEIRVNAVPIETRIYEVEDDG